jgi:hypothetical protein
VHQLELYLNPTRGKRAPVEAYTYRFTRDALVEDRGQKRIVYGLWERLFGCWVFNSRTCRSREIVPTWRPFNRHDVWRDQLRLRAFAGNHCDYSSRWRYEANAVFAAYFSGIPQRMRSLVASFGRYQWLALDLIWQHPEIAPFLDEEIYNGTQQFTFACFALARPDKISRQRRRDFAVALMSRKRTEFLTELLGTTCTRSTLRTICKLGDAPCRPEVYQAVIQCMTGGGSAKALSHADDIDPSSIENLNSLPRSFLLPNVVQIFLTNPKAAGSLQRLIDGQEGSALSTLLYLFPTASPEFQARATHSLSRARNSADFLKWSAKWEQRIDEVLKFPAPPINHLGPLVPITSAVAMRKEARGMRNCLWDLIPSVIKGTTYFYHWEGAEPATVMITRNSIGDPWLWRALGFDNAPLGNRMEHSIRCFLETQLFQLNSQIRKGNMLEKPDE